MFEKDEIVLYKMLLCSVADILETKDKKIYLLETLEQEEYQIQVPYANAYHHIKPLPSKQELMQLLQSLTDQPDVMIYSNAVDKCCQPLLDSYRIEDLLRLAKTTFANKKAAALSGRKFNFKEKAYMEKVLVTLSILYAYTFQISSADAEKMIVDAIDHALPKELS